MIPNGLAALLLVGAFVLLVAALWLRRTTGVPWARVVIADTSSWRQIDRPLMSRRYNLVGKPDYVIATRAGEIPIEVKPGRKARTPYASDLMQLAAYCLLVEETTGRAPPYGLLRYAGDTFKLRYTAAVRAELLALLADLQADREADDVARSHREAARCRGCGFVDICDQALV